MEWDPVDVATVFVDVEDEVVYGHYYREGFIENHVKEEKHKRFLIARTNTATNPTNAQAKRWILRAVVVHLENAPLTAATVMCSIGLNGFTFPNSHKIVENVRAMSVHRAVSIILLDPF